MTTRDENIAFPPEPDPRGSSARPVTLHGCENSHTFFFPHQTCPLCNARTARIESPSDAVLVSRTVVRVSPGGSPFGLGLARVASGAQTLCIIDGELENETDQRVVLEKRGGLYYAIPKRVP